MPTDPSLKNRGLIPFGSRAQARPRTLIVLGAGRGGTSLFAGILAKLGVSMGRDARPPVFEDVRLARVVEGEQWDEVRAIVREYDDAHDVWGFKRPSLFHRLTELHPLLREPFYVMVFRDLAAIARRNMISMRQEACVAMREALRSYAALLTFMERDDVRGLAVSNEKALMHPAEIIDALVDHCGLSQHTTPDRIEAARGFVRVDPSDYLERTRLRFLGRIDSLTLRAVAGWACIRGRSDPVSLNVSVSGHSVATIKADQLRNDVRNRGLHATGACGFHFVFPAESAPQPGDEVAVQFEQGGDHIHGSPRVTE